MSVKTFVWDGNDYLQERTATGPVKNFYAGSGQLLGERSVGDDFSRYLPDALGNITAARKGKTLSTSNYTPLGRGTSPTNTTVGWAGGTGAMPTGLTYASHYTVTRHY